MAQVASIEITGEPADGLWHIGARYLLHITELNALGNVVHNAADTNVGANPNWNYTHAYGLLTPGVHGFDGGGWNAVYTPRSVGDEAIAATFTAGGHIFQSIILTDNVA
jgi:hypothetical protein